MKEGRKERKKKNERNRDGVMVLQNAEHSNNTLRSLTFTVTS